MVLHINKKYGVVDETGESVNYLGSAVDAHIWGVGHMEIPENYIGSVSDAYAIGLAHLKISKIYIATVDNVVIRQISIHNDELVFESTNQ